MKPLLIGSLALKLLTDDTKIIPTDIDFVVSNLQEANELIKLYKGVIINIEKSMKFKTVTKAIKAGEQVIEITYPVNSKCSTFLMLQDNISTQDFQLSNGLTVKVPSLEFLYSMKLSHRYLKDSPHFVKTLKSIIYFRNLNIQPSNLELFKLREKETYNYKHPNLNTSKNEFFNSNFNYVYDHDSIHESIKFLDKPAYEYYSISEVQCSKDKFFEQPRTIQLLGVIEEVYVLALERSQIPTNFSVDPRTSFLIALEKVCTSITSGWFREFAYDNYLVLYNMYDKNYVEKFKYALKNGIIKPFTKNY